MKPFCCALGLVVVALGSLGAAELRVPAFTAYLTPDANGARVTARGITGWNDSKLRVLWFGEFTSAGKLTAAVTMRLAKGSESKLRLHVGEDTRDALLVGAGAGQPVTVNFGEFTFQATCYCR